jgi:hypothetical protein
MEMWLRKIYHTLVCPVVTCGSESWTLTVEEERTLAKGKNLRKIYGPVKDNELWRVQRNDKLQIIIKGENIVRMRKNTMAWAYRKNARHRNSKKDAIRKAICYKTKRKT